MAKTIPIPGWGFFAENSARTIPIPGWGYWADKTVTGTNRLLLLNPPGVDGGFGTGLSL